MPQHYFEDFEVGPKFTGAGRIRVDEARIKSFAAEFDPQPFHLDDEAAARSFFRGLAASGWHTAAVTMRLFVEGELKPAGGIIGAGFWSATISEALLPLRPMPAARQNHCARLRKKA